MSQRSFLTNFARENLQTLNLRRFFGDYRTFAFDPEYFHLGIGEIANITDDATWQRIMHDFDRDPRLVSRATMYSGTRGEHEANQAMAEHVGALLGRADLDEQHVVPYDGGHNAVNGVIRACVAPLGSPRDERQYVLLPTPCYPYFSTILNAHCGVIAYTAYSSEEMVRGIETLINPQVGMVLLNIPHNPTGYALTPEQVARLNRAVAPYDCVLAMDMVYALNALDPQAIHTLGGLDPERTIHIDSFSKKFGLPGFRLGFALCANAELIEALRMIKAAESVSTSNVKLLLAAHLLQHHMALAETTAATIRQRYQTFRAALVGIDRRRLALAILAVSGAMTGLASVLLAQVFYVSPEAGYSPLVKGLIVALLGGLGSVPGTILAALLVAATEALTATYLGGQYVLMTLFLLIAVVLLIRPRGLGGLLEAVRA